MWEGLCECVTEARTEHHDELRVNMVSNATGSFPETCRQRERVRLTAILGLSARTYSCGGEAGRFFFGGGETSLTAALEPFLKYLSRVSPRTGFNTSSSSVEGAEEREEISEEDIAIRLGRWMSATQIHEKDKMKSTL